MVSLGHNKIYFDFFTNFTNFTIALNTALPCFRVRMKLVRTTFSNLTRAWAR